PALLIWLDGVGNPHNVGALLRSAANFNARGAILPAGAPALSGAAMRVAEGGAEVVPLAQAAAGEDVFASLHDAGFAVAATVPRAGWGLYENKLPDRLALILGAEGEGMSARLIADADLRLTIPGTGAVESLNVSASAAVLFAEYWRQHR
ncbi:TrmH family RNA methyltransferase, partial [Rudaea sp.]|uniref:TrmH family RNA methyltransferase n=1 Tax=Rudaea sp. TaxID=2136325 RepID=UPI002ECFFD1C